MSHLVIFLEERSAKNLLDAFLPRILPAGVTHKCIPFEGKQDLDKQIERRIKGWIAPDTAFLILRDQDSADCLSIKQNLYSKAQAAGRPDTIVRIACRELESWYFGDLQAVESALDLQNLQHYAAKAIYRVPDQIVNPCTELKKITKYHYQKTSGSRSIGAHLCPDRNTSRSFQVFYEGIQKALAALTS